MSEESEQFKKRIRELADKSYSSSQYFFTDFLTEAEISDALSLGKNAFASGITIYGGYESAERRMLRFGSLEEFGYEEPFPIKVIKIAPLLEKFSDEFTHRDFLGAILNLGIDRKVTGDILIKGKTAYLFCEEKMAEYIADNLYQVKHTHIKCDIIDEIPEGIGPELKLEEYQINSERLDAIIAHVFHLSREKALEYFRGQRVSVNGRLMENQTHAPKVDDIVSVKGCGRFKYKGVERTTKKGKLKITVEKYI